MKKEELLSKAIRIYDTDKIPPLKGIFIIQERKLHDSGYRLMNIIGHTDYDNKLKDFKYYLLSTCSDVVDFIPDLDNFSFYADLHLDIDKNGIIHIWTNGKKEFVCEWVNLSSCMLRFKW